jgi:hypothetical protein
MKWLLIGLGLLSLAATSTPLLSDTTVRDGNKIIVYVQYEANPANTDVTVAVTALDSTPPEWAVSTVSHVWFVDPVGGHFNDEWPNMRTGHFRVGVMLHRTTGKTIYAPPIFVDIQ